MNLLLLSLRLILLSTLWKNVKTHTVFMCTSPGIGGLNLYAGNYHGTDAIVGGFIVSQGPGCPTPYSGSCANTAGTTDATAHPWLCGTRQNFDASKGKRTYAQILAESPTVQCVAVGAAASSYSLAGANVIYVTGFLSTATASNYGISTTCDAQFETPFGNANTWQIVQGNPLSSFPTYRPTYIPTRIPTEIPTAPPTLTPTSLPTLHPTSATPTKIPTSMPTTIPTSNPTSLPTGLPTGCPSSLPSFIPSGEPTTTPSGVPTSYPSFYPSSIPSSVPSGSPSGLPTCIPTGVPTSFPSSVPSSCPSGEPSAEPTGAPTGNPSYYPTSLPTTVPSREPSGYPTGNPSSCPTSEPTSLPSGLPSATPTSCPTSGPSSSPTSCPSFEPSSLPSSLPSTIPSATPTFEPSSVPSALPSSIPSGEPTSVPTSLPTGVPSSFPSSEPSSFPTGLPSSLPSSQPSGQPTSEPTVEPSANPTAQPSSLPSSCPSSLPSGVPTSLPSSEPSSAPSSQPTFVDSINISKLGIRGTIISNSNYDFMVQRLVEIGDTNGDGRSDFIIETIAASADETEANLFFVLFGQVDYPEELDINQNTTGIEGYTIFSDISPLTVAAKIGDLNFDDLSEYTVSSSFYRNDMGIVYLIYGTVEIRISLNVDKLSKSQGFVIRGATSQSLFGVSLAGVGDINGDNCPDILIGSSALGVSGIPHAGAAYLLYCRKDGLYSNYIASDLIGVNGATFQGTAYGGALGSWVSSLGDVNSDGLNDVGIGEPRSSSSGILYVIFGGSSFPSVLSPSTNLGSQGFCIVSSKANSNGLGLMFNGIGDFNGDFIDDFAIHITFSTSTITNTYIVYGNLSLGSQDANTLDLESLDLSSGQLLIADWYAGSFVGGFDVNKDGHTDFILPTKNYNYIDDTVAHIVYGNTDHVYAISLGAMSSVNGIALVVEPSDDNIWRTGLSSANIGDVDLDGFNDFAIVTDETSFNEKQTNGLVYLLTNIKESETKRPSAVPTHFDSQYTNKPSTFPSSRPSRRPTSSPTSFSPTLLPTRRPSTHPSISPSRFPTTEDRLGIDPTSSPSIVITTEPSYDNSPSQIPSPSNSNPRFSGTVQFIINIGGTFTGEVYNENFIINSTMAESPIIINGRGGYDMYTVYPAPYINITITDFNASICIIDLRSYPTILGMNDLTIVAGSVFIYLDTYPNPNRFIKLLGLTPNDISEKNFLFADPIDNEPREGTLMTVLIWLAIVLALWLVFRIVICIGESDGIIVSLKEKIKYESVLQPTWSQKKIENYFNNKYDDNVNPKQDKSIRAQLFSSDASFILRAINSLHEHRTLDRAISYRLIALLSHPWLEVRETVYHFLYHRMEENMDVGLTTETSSLLELQAHNLFDDVRTHAQELFRQAKALPSDVMTKLMTKPPANEDKFKIMSYETTPKNSDDEDNSSWGEEDNQQEGGGEFNIEDFFRSSSESPDDVSKRSQSRSSTPIIRLLGHRNSSPCPNVASNYSTDGEEEKSPEELWTLFQSNSNNNNNSSQHDSDDSWG